MSKRQRNILMCAGGVLVGAVLYILFWKEAYVSRLFNSLPCVAGLRRFFGGRWGGWLSFYVPDFLWAFSLSYGIQAICLPKWREIVMSAAAVLICGQYGRCCDA